MKKFALILSLVFSITLFAQDTVEKTIGEFTTVKVYDLINLNMIQSKENKVVISGKNRKDVEVVNKNGKLKKIENILPLLSHELTHTALNHVKWRDDDHGRPFNSLDKLILKHLKLNM